MTFGTVLAHVSWITLVAITTFQFIGSALILCGIITAVRCPIHVCSYVHEDCNQ